MLRIEAIGKSYHGRAGAVSVLRNFSLELKAGDFLAVQGPSGSGKSTLLLAAGGMLRPDSGKIAVDGTNLYALPAEARASFRGAKIGFVFQQFHLVPYLNTLENVLCAALAKPAADARQRAAALLEQYGLAHRLKHAASELSTGERQRAALACALLNRPVLLLADEPTGNLDDENAAVVLRHLRDFAESGGTVLLVTHQDKAAEHADRILRLPGAAAAQPAAAPPVLRS